MGESPRSLLDRCQRQPFTCSPFRCVALIILEHGFTFSEHLSAEDQYNKTASVFRPNHRSAPDHAQAWLGRMSKWVLRVCGVTAFGVPANKQVARPRNSRLSFGQKRSMDVSIEKTARMSRRMLFSPMAVPIVAFHSQNSAPPPFFTCSLFCRND